MPTHPLLSIVVPTYNYANYLGRCLSSLLEQLTPDAELIVIDDGSTDETPAVVASIASDPANFKYIRQDNRGAAAARNHGVQLASGEFVLFLDADDELLPDTVPAVCRCLRDNPDVDLLIGGRASVRADKGERISMPRVPSTPCERLSDFLVHRRFAISHGSFAARRKLLLERPYPVSLRKREDIPVYAYLLAQGRVVTIDRAMVRIHKHQSSLRHRNVGKEMDPEGFAEEVFRALPANCQYLRSSYLALRCQSAMRGALAERRWQDALSFFRKSLRQDWLITLSPALIRKALRATVTGKK